MFVVVFIHILSISAFAACPLGDLNNDCRVSNEDIRIFAEQWLLDENCSGRNCANLDGIGSVNFTDFAILAENWTKKESALPKIYAQSSQINPCFINRDSEDEFVPLGSNYIKLDWINGVAYHTIFTTGLYDPAAAENALAEMEQSGYNVVRVFVDRGDPDHRARSQYGIGGPFETYTSNLYQPFIDNVIDFLRKARSHKIYAILVCDMWPNNYYYEVLANSYVPANVENVNIIFLAQGAVDAKCLYMRKLVEAVKNAEPCGELLSTIFAWEIANEISVNVNYKPFSMTSGTVSPADGLTYRMRSFYNERQKCMDAGIIYWANNIADNIRAIDPNALVAASVFTYQAVGKLGPNGVLPYNPADSRFPARPLSLLASSNLSYVDVHLFPSGSSYSIDDDLMSSEYSNWNFNAKPLLMGEYGAFKSFYPNINNAANEMLSHRQNAFDRSFKGALYWTWDTFSQTQLWHLIDEDGVINDILKPKDIIISPEIKTRITSQFHTQILTQTYNSIINRISPDGYFPESLTDAYPGMYPRTVGALCRLLIETGHANDAEKIINYCITAMTDNNMDRIPHIIGEKEITRIPIQGTSMPAGLDTSIAFAQIYSDRGAAQTFIADSPALQAVEVYGTYLSSIAHFNIKISDNSENVILNYTPTIIEDPCSGWLRLPLPAGVELVDGRTYRIEFRAADSQTNYIMYAGYKITPSFFASAYQFDGNGYYENPGLTLSIIFDYGYPAYQNGPLKARIISTIDQIDGQASLIMAWAMLALKRGHTAFEDNTYSVISELMNSTIKPPYLESGTSCTGLIRNYFLEHSRENRMWDAYDFLSQSFVASALENMIKIAQRRGDTTNYQLWDQRLTTLNNNITQYMTRYFNGANIYYEMLLPNTGCPQEFPGMGWINLAPIPSGWESVNHEIFKNTIDTWHNVAEINWEGPRVYSNDWLPDGYTDVFGNHVSNQVIGKALGWDIVYCLEAGEYDRICDMLDFIEQVNAPQLYAEAFYYASDGQWYLNDPGNGEQACWLTWAMAVLRNKLGLTPVP